MPITASASGTYGGFYGPDRAFNGERGNANGEWAQNGGREWAWLMADFGAGKQYRIDTIRISPFSDNGGTPRTFLWEWSDNAVDWTLHFIGIYDGEYPWMGVVEFTLPQQKALNRYVGFAVTKSAGEKYHGEGAGTYKDLVAAEIEMAETPGGPNVAVGGTPHWYRSGDPVDSLFNGNRADDPRYNGGNTPLPAIWYDFGPGVEKAIAEVRYIRGTVYNGNFKRSPAEGFYIYSQDGRSWRVGNPIPDVAYGPSGVGDRDMGTFLVDPIPDENAVVRRRAAIIVT